VTLPIRLRSAAEEDLVDAARHLQEQNLELAIRFLEAFDSAANLLARSPAIGGLSSFKKPRFCWDSRLAHPRLQETFDFLPHIAGRD
jgi:plasmid stabilization system protein ParE